MILMKFSRSLALVSVTALTLGLSACSSSTPTKDASTLSVSASFYPLAWLTKAIGGEDVAVTSVTPAHVEPHDFELSPADIANLSKSSAVIYVAGFQASLDEALTEISGPKILDLSDTVHLKPAADTDTEDESSDSHEHKESTENHVSEGDDYDEDATGKDSTADGHDHDHDATASNTEKAHVHSHFHTHDGNDPHFWLDPERMSDAAKAISAQLSELAPEKADTFKANTAKIVDKLEDLDKAYSMGLSTCERRTIVTNHSAFGYLTSRYGLTQVSISGIDPESEPSPAELAKVKNVISQTGTTTIFTETLLSTKTAELLAKEAGVRTATLNPLESQPDSGDYVSQMQTNLSALTETLACK